MTEATTIARNGADGAPQNHRHPWAPTVAQEPATATRLLSATTHLHGDYADHVYATFLSPSHQAWAPCWGVDTVELARHALWARQRRRLRDVELAQVAWAAFAVMGVTVADARLVGGGTTRLAAVLAVCAAIAWLAACTLVYRYYWCTHAIARGALDGGVEPEIEETEELKELGWFGPAESSNVVVFDGESPFVDMGTNRAEWLFKVDTSSGKRDEEGDAVTPTPFTTTELSDFVLREVSDGLPDVRCATRLYVNGLVAPQVPGLMYRSCTGFVRPRTTIHPAVVGTFTETPTEGARSYVCFQKVIWEGQVVVSFLMHFHRMGDLLFVETSVWALSPLDDQFRDGLRLARDVRDDRAGLVWTSVTATTGLLLRSAYRAALSPGRDRRRQERRADAFRRELRRGTPINYGSEESLRSEAAEPEELERFSHTDITIHVRRIETNAFRALKTFLDDRGVDVGPLSDQFNLILYQNTVTITNSAINTGDQGNARVTTTGAADPAQSPAASAEE